METYLTVCEVAAAVKLSVQTIRRYVLKGEIPFHRIYRAVRFKPSEIELWIEKREAAKSAAAGKNLEGGLFGGTETVNGGGVGQGGETGGAV